MKPLRIGIVVPHIFMQDQILPEVIFSPGEQALLLADGLTKLGQEVVLFTPGPITTPARNVTADLSGFEAELAVRGDSYIDLLKKHPLTFISLARQVQAELLAAAYQMANQGELDIVHIYTNEEETALPFAQFCQQPVVFTHHDPFNFWARYRSIMPRYKHLPWISLSLVQRHDMPEDTNWLANIYHGLPRNQYTLSESPRDYVAYLGRIIQPKGVHLAIRAVQQYNAQPGIKPLKLRIAGKHYSGEKDDYWQKFILPEIDDKTVFYDGYLKTVAEKQRFLGNAQALLVPSLFNEPFGMVSIEAAACGTPVIGLVEGATKEIVGHGTSGFIIDAHSDTARVTGMTEALGQLSAIDRRDCRWRFEHNFTSDKMCQKHLQAYRAALTK